MKSRLLTKLFLAALTVFALPPAGHCFYNPSTGRWLTRDPIGEKGGQSLYCFAKNDPILNIDVHGKITVSPGMGGKSTCGTYGVGWVFSLDRPAPCRGYIIQKVTTRDKVGLCGKGGFAQERVFWEAFAIEEGATTPRSVVSPAGIPVSDLDIHVNPGPNWGYHHVFGEIKFFCSDTIGDLAESGFETGRAKESGDLPSAPNEPSWWNRDSDNGEGTASRFASANWNCCCKQSAGRFNTIDWRP